MSESFIKRFEVLFPEIAWGDAGEISGDDSVIRYLMRKLAPRRHLEFGTWKGEGVMRVLESCDASVWTLNLWEGEDKADGTWAYGESTNMPDWEILPQFEQRYGRMLDLRTDAGALIGHKYLAAGMGHRVNQIYCDSRKWDDLAYPDGFFDSAFVDGGHDAETARSDMYRALRLLRPGGLLLLHDFCPDPSVNAQNPSTVGVTAMVAEELSTLRELCEDVFYIEGTWLLCAVRKRQITEQDREREKSVFAAARERGSNAVPPVKPQKDKNAATRNLLYDSAEDHMPVAARYAKDGCDVFPTSEDDHVWTPFFFMPPVSEQTIFLKLDFGGDNDGSQVYQCLAQDEDYSTIGAAVWPPHNDEKELRIRIMNPGIKMRLIFVPHSQAPHAVPVGISVMTDTPVAAFVDRLRKSEKARISLLRAKDEVIAEKDRVIFEKQRDVDNLLASRWRKLGRKLGIVKKY